MDTSNLWSLLWGSFLRHAVTVAGTGFVADGIFTDEDWMKIVGVVGILGAFAWSQAQKFFFSKKA